MCVFWTWLLFLVVVSLAIVVIIEKIVVVLF